MRGARRHPTGWLPLTFRVIPRICETSPACEIQCAMRHPHARFSVRCVTRMRDSVCDTSPAREFYSAIRHPPAILTMRDVIPPAILSCETSPACDFNHARRHPTCDFTMRFVTHLRFNHAICHPPTILTII